MPSRRSDGTGVLIAGGAVATAAFEWSNPDTLGRLSPGDRVVNAVFHSVSLRSAGFDSVGVGALLDETLVVGIALMFIGGAPGSTAGGTRINTVAALVIASLSAAGPEARLEQHVTFEAPEPEVADVVRAADQGKYDRYGPRIVDSVVSTDAVGATLRVLPI